jgi:hypothetical protein
VPTSAPPDEGLGVISLWDVYLDADDASTVLDALVVLERHRAVREPPPIEDVEELVRRLTTIARLSDEDAVHWQREAADRAADAEVDGGRWGSTDVAQRMAAVASEVADGYRAVARAADTAANDLEDRLSDVARDELRRAAAQTSEQAEELLRRLEHDT